MANFRMMIYALSVLFFSSCKKPLDAVASNPSCKSKPAIISGSIIIGNNDWIDYKKINDLAEIANERTVAQIKIPSLMATCNAFLINEDTIMTNNHCIGSSAGATNVTALFRDVSGVRESFSCNQFIMTSLQYDFTLVRCDRAPGLKYGWVGLSKVKPVQNSSIYIFQENCDYFTDPYCTTYKYFASGSVIQSLITRTFHDVDTLPGSSGSPIFSKDNHQVIALHHAGVAATSSMPAMNEGVPMVQIRSVIEANPNVTIYEYGSAGNTGGVIIPSTPTPSLPTTSTPSAGGSVGPLENCSK